MDETHIECREHGRQEVFLYTRYDPRARPRDVPDRFVCAECVRLSVTPTEGNSLRIGPPHPEARLRAAIVDLSRHFARWNEPDLSKAVEDTLDCPGELPTRVMELFTEGIGGLLDRPLRKRSGSVDEQATHRRDLLADEARSAAKDALA